MGFRSTRSRPSVRGCLPPPLDRAGARKCASCRCRAARTPRCTAPSSYPSKPGRLSYSAGLRHHLTVEQAEPARRIVRQASDDDRARCSTASRRRRQRPRAAACETEIPAPCQHSESAAPLLGRARAHTARMTNPPRLCCLNGRAIARQAYRSK